MLTDLTASYAAGSQQIIGALRDLERETGRTAMNLEPVRMNTDEFYQILRKRIFETLPPDETKSRRSRRATRRRCATRSRWT